MNNRLHNKVKAFEDLGSFWSKNVDKQQFPFIGRLSRLTVASSFQTKFEESVLWLAGESTVPVENELLRFKGSDIVTLDYGLNQRVKSKALDASGNLYVSITRPVASDYTNWTKLYSESEDNELSGMLTETGEFILFPVGYKVDDGDTLTLEEKEIKYVMPIPHGLVPTVISSESGEFVIGISFIVKNGFIIWEEPPLSIFKDNSFVIRSGWKKVKNPYDYVWSVESV